MLNFTSQGDCFKGISYLIWMLRRQGKDNRNLLRSQNSNGHVFRKSPKKQNDFSFFYTLKTMLACREIKPESSFITQNFLKNNLLIAKMLLDTLVVLFRRIERKEDSRN